MTTVAQSEPEPGMLQAISGRTKQEVTTSELQNNPSSGSNDCSWSEVMASMEAASQEYKVKGENHKMRALQRNHAVAATLASLTDMIPESDGLSVLRGGLNSIFKLLRKRIENGERILAAFEDIPMTFSEACHALSAHPNDEPLRTYVFELYLTVKEQVTKLTEVLLRKHKASLPKRLLKQHPENESAVIDTSLELITRASRRVSIRVSSLATGTMLDILKETRNISQEVSRNQLVFTKLQEGLDSIQNSQLENIEARYEHQELLVHAFAKSITQSLQNSLASSTSHFRQGFGGTQASLQELMWHAQPIAPQLVPDVCGFSVSRSPSPCRNYEITCPPTIPMPTTVIMSYDELYMILRLTDPYFQAKDLDLILRASNSMGKEGLARAAWLLSTQRFQRWAQIPNSSSDILLVDGHLGEHCRGKISPLSVLSATFASMNKLPHFIILTHFCGLHTNLNDPMNGCRGMMLSLVAQLITNRPNDPGNTRVGLEDALLQAITLQDLGALCQLFQVLLDQMSPDVTVYCVLDDIAQFETNLRGWWEELNYVVQMMQAITSQRRRGPVLKVLLTTAQRSIKVCRQINRKDFISLSAGNQSPMSTKRLSIENGWNEVLGSNEQSLRPPGQLY
ncbi:hypothetical protein FSARC_6254 [Fusarium sarcochroum]|uniref:Nephrocystin 3-like N-terminal domain-containing protein n=1 Tax=Fusarium sarcochroum TaxID=1208366 RepID=A0A8H4TY41_9HYPO|nr:hypothetical protein FSARC_6254 [Fusarium sarcochroum]